MTKKKPYTQPDFTTIELRSRRAMLQVTSPNYNPFNPEKDW